MIESQYQWQFNQLFKDKRVIQLQNKIEVNPLIAQILIDRGYETLEDVQKFLNPTQDDLNDPYQLHDMKKAVNRIFEAIDKCQKIIVYGDYDVDGITATTIMVSALEVLGAEVDYYIPNRFKDGYGPNVLAYENLIQQGMELLITVDNGISGKDAIETVMNKGIDVIVTDHHQLPDQLPKALAIIHPQVQKNTYPFIGLSGAGVAFKLASALLGAPADEWIDLVALGTIADVVPLVSENRVIVKLGLDSLKEMQRPGIKALLQVAEIESKIIDTTMIGFQIAPRLNAIGRMLDAKIGVQLLLSENEEEALTLARKIDQANQDRKKLVEVITDEAFNQAKEQFIKDSILVLVGENWHEGVLGIVAARILELTGKPTIVLNKTGETAKGSGRSLDEFDLFTAMNNYPDLYINFGGHALAAGLTINVSNISTFRKILNEAASEQNFNYKNKQILKITGKLTNKDFNDDFYEQLKLLEPFGEGNREPIFTLELDNIQNIKSMSNGKHLRFTGIVNQKPVPIVAWQKGELINELRGHFQKLIVAGTMDRNTYRGVTNYQLMFKDIEISGSAFIDARTNHLTQKIFSRSLIYLFFNKQIKQQLESLIPEDGKAIFWQDVFNSQKIEHVVFVDLPQNLDELHQVLSYVSIGTLETVFYTKNPAYLQKIPTRSDFAKFYKFIQQQNFISLKKDLSLAGQHLNMNISMLKLIIQVFLDAKFVTIENGLLKKMKSSTNVNLKVMPSYQRFLQKREVEAKLVYSTTTELEKLLNELLKND